MASDGRTNQGGERPTLVDFLPRRTAHATYALLEAAREHATPVTAAEVMIYDSEAVNPRGTAAALREAARRGLAVYLPPAYWTPTGWARKLQDRLEDRYIRDTAEEASVVRS